MMTCVLLTAGLLGTASACPSVGSPEQGPRKEFVIDFAWQQTEQWSVEIRGYQFRRGLPPVLPTAHWNIELRGYREHRGLPPGGAVEVITIDWLADVPVPRVEAVEARYSSDLRALLEQVKHRER
jgi:hypothetical protein